MNAVEPLETHLKPSEIAAAWRLHTSTVYKIFADEPGVLRIANPRRGRRSYTTLRIPRSIADSVYRRRTGLQGAA